LLIDAYGGPYVNQKVGKFIQEVEDIEKKKHTDVGPHCKTPDDKADPKKRIEEQNQNSNL
jgi:hypothetical protein